MAFNKFKKREPIMDAAEREIWNQIQKLYISLGFEDVLPVDIMYSRRRIEDAKQLLWELERYAKTIRTYPAKDTGSKPAYTAGIMNLDPVGMT